MARKKKSIAIEMAILFFYCFIVFCIVCGIHSSTKTQKSIKLETFLNGATDCDVFG